MYVKIVENAVDTFPYNIGALKLDNPEVSFPKNVDSEILSAYGVYEVAEQDMPNYDEKTENVSINEAPTLVDGSWVLGWTTTDKTPEEIAEAEDRKSQQNRTIRDSLLAETDWTANSDVTMSTEMATYRQALRDITDHANWPYLEDADWPTKPV